MKTKYILLSTILIIVLTLTMFGQTTRNVKTKMGKMKDNNMEMDKATKEAIMIGNVTHILWPKSS